MSEENDVESASQSSQRVQITKNCHYISRFLTRPWEFGQKQLHFYDFDTNTFGHLSSRSLFAGDYVNAPAVELWLRDTIETPLGIVRPRLTKGDPHALDDWRFFRAAVLLVWLQGVRFQSVVDEDVRHDMNRLAAMPIQQLDALVATIKQDYDLRLVFTVISGDTFAPLYMPSSGIFPFIFGDPGCQSGHSIGVGLPLDVHCALVLTPAERNGAADFSLLRASLSNCSIGTSQSRRVVFPPALLDVMSEASARQILQELRRESDTMQSTVQELRRKILEMFSTVGIRLAQDKSGRVLPPMI